MSKAPLNQRREDPIEEQQEFEIDEYSSTPAETFISGQHAVRSDSYKLSVEEFPKNVANDNERPNFVGMEHSHIFHTHDQRGRQQEYSCPIGGHFHKMEIRPDSRGSNFPPIIKCVSGPLKWVSRKDKYGSHTRVAVPAYENIEGGTHLQDNQANHKHRVKYIGTSSLKSTTANVEAAKLMSMMAPPAASAEVKG